jgi:hypothetical protein
LEYPFKYGQEEIGEDATGPNVEKEEGYHNEGDIALNAIA